MWSAAPSGRPRRGWLFAWLMRGDDGASDPNDPAASTLKVAAYRIPPTTTDGGNHDHSNHSRCRQPGFGTRRGRAGSAAGIVIRPVGDASGRGAGGGFAPDDGKLTGGPQAAALVNP